MKKVYAMAAAALLLSLSSCLSTVQPIFTEKDLVFDARLLGKWGYKTGFEEARPDSLKGLEKNPSLQRRAKIVTNVTATTTDTSITGSFSGYAEITKATLADVQQFPALQKLLGKMYLVKYHDNDGNTGSMYYGFLVKLGEKYYMDYYPAQAPEAERYNSFYTSHYLKMHTCYSIHFTKNNRFELKQFDENFLKNLIDNKKISIRHETAIGGEMIVTASTQELQQYIMKYSEVPEAYYSENSSIYTRIHRR